MTTKIGYSRVSTRDQRPEVQRKRLEEAGCTRVFEDHGVSGKLAERPEWGRCLDRLESGDTLVAVRLDRIGRSVKNLIDVVNTLAERGVDLVILDQGIDTTTPVGRFMFHVIASVAQFEADLIRERTLDGLAATKARGRNGGRKPSLKPYQVEHARSLIGVKPVTEIAAELGVSRQTIYRALETKAG